MTTPEISVIIPLFNKGPHLKRTLDSVSNQSYRDFEIIVIDDGSTDTGPAIAAEYDDKRLRLIQQRNSGPGAARNRGVAESKADYITFIDADDEWMKDFLEVSLENLQNNPDCMLSVTSHVRGENKTRWEAEELLNVTGGKWQLPVDMDVELMGLAVGYIHSAGAVMARRKVVEEFGGFYENHCKFGEDRHLWLRILLNYPIYREPRALFWYHDEDSELAIEEGKKNRPMQPILTDPQIVRESCPAKYKKLLEKFFAFYAIKDAHMFCYFGHFDKAKYLVKKFPKMRQWFLEYLKLRIKLITSGIN